MRELIATRGYPASGKTVWCTQWAAAEPNRARVCRNDLRFLLFGAYGVLPHFLELKVTAAEHAAVQALLINGMDVVLDGPGLHLEFLRDWADLARRLDVEFRVQDFQPPVETCIERDSRRDGVTERRVGEATIRDMADRHPYALWMPVTAHDDPQRRPQGINHDPAVRPQVGRLPHRIGLPQRRVWRHMYAGRPLDQLLAGLSAQRRILATAIWLDLEAKFRLLDHQVRQEFDHAVAEVGREDVRAFAAHITRAQPRRAWLFLLWNGHDDALPRAILRDIKPRGMRLLPEDTP